MRTSHEGGTLKMIRRLALRIGAPALLALIAWNAFLALNHLKQMQNTAALTRESSTIQADISTVQRDLTDMETGQRGYLLTGNPIYLQPYNEAKARIGSDFDRLRVGLENRPENERLQLSQLESLSNSKQTEMERSITLRQQGYRRRSFNLVDSNEGMEYMAKARELLSSLSDAAARRTVSFDQERNTRLRNALSETIIANLCLLLLTACLIGVIRSYGRRLEQDAAKSKLGLVVSDLKLEKLTSVLSNEARSNTSTIEANASLLLENYGGFLPRQGHEYAEQIREASAQMERLRQDLVASQSSNRNERAA
jgi:CHASE3 domain sensor protein